VVIEPIERCDSRHFHPSMTRRGVTSHAGRVIAHKVFFADDPDSYNRGGLPGRKHRIVNVTRLANKAPVTAPDNLNETSDRPLGIVVW
jgi:hypothetical protein